MQFNGLFNTETKRLLEDMDNIEEWGGYETRDCYIFT